MTKCLTDKNIELFFYYNEVGRVELLINLFSCHVGTLQLQLMFFYVCLFAYQYAFVNGIFMQCRVLFSISRIEIFPSGKCIRSKMKCIYIWFEIYFSSWLSMKQNFLSFVSTKQLQFQWNDCQFNAWSTLTFLHDFCSIKKP